MLDRAMGASSPVAGGPLQQRRAAARRVGAAFAEHPAVSAVLVFGSVALGHVDERSDVDLLVIYRDELLPARGRAALLAGLGASAWAHQTESRRGENPLFADEDEGEVDGIPVTVHYQTAPWIAEVLDAVIGRGAITTLQVPFRPYTLPALLQRAWVLADHDRQVARWRQEVAVFPAALKRNLLEYFAPRLRACTEELVAGAERRLGPRHFVFFLDRAVDALVGLLFALNDTFDPADRRTERVILPTLARVPAGFIPTLTDVLEGPFDDAGALRRGRLFDRLASEGLQMAAPDLPPLPQSHHPSRSASERRGGA
jgi:hypothetical protein